MVLLEAVQPNVTVFGGGVPASTVGYVCITAALLGVLWFFYPAVSDRVARAKEAREAQRQKDAVLVAAAAPAQRETTQQLLLPLQEQVQRVHVDFISRLDRTHSSIGGAREQLSDIYSHVGNAVGILGRIENWASNILTAITTHGERQNNVLARLGEIDRSIDDLKSEVTRLSAQRERGGGDGPRR